MICIHKFDILDGKEVSVVFSSEVDRDRFIDFHKKACELFDEYAENYEDPNDYRGMGWVGQDGRP